MSMPLNSRRVAFKAFTGSANGSDIIVSAVILAGRMVLNIPSALQSWLPGPIFDEITYSIVRLRRCIVSFFRTFSTLPAGVLSTFKDRGLHIRFWIPAPFCRDDRLRCLGI